MPVDAKTIQIFLPDGEPRGIRIAEITTRIVQAVQVPRARLDRFMQRPECDHIGVYFLFADSDDSAKPIAYIGQTEDFKGRLRKHHADKEFWTTAVLLISKTNSFTLAHIHYLEWYSIKLAKEAGRYRLENGNAAGKPYITEPMEKDVLEAFETGSILLSTLGFPLFEPVAGRTKTEAEGPLFYCNDAAASGRLVEDGFVILKGSRVRARAHRSIGLRQKSMETDGILVADGPSLRFTEDYLCNSPSGAAMIVLGRNANGWIEWKTADGRTLHAVEREDVEAASAFGAERE